MLAFAVSSAASAANYFARFSVAEPLYVSSSIASNA